MYVCVAIVLSDMKNWAICIKVKLGRKNEIFYYS